LRRRIVAGFGREATMDQQRDMASFGMVACHAGRIVSLISGIMEILCLAWLFGIVVIIHVVCGLIISAKALVRKIWRTWWRADAARRGGVSLLAS
jgi:hypothetical protein